MTTALSKALQFALGQTWAMEPGAHRQMMSILHRHAEGVRLTEDELLAATGTDQRRQASDMRVEKGVAYLPIQGVISHRASSVGRLSGPAGTSVEGIRRDLQAALADPGVQAIQLQVDSPGGSVSGIAELADEIRAAREQKPIVAHTDSTMASAAYWLASQANKVVASKSATVGSIGVIASGYDDHRAAQNAGFDPVVIKSVPGKGGVQSNGSMSDQDRADAQARVDAHHAMFVEGVAAGRGITMEQAKAMGDGKVSIGAEALSKGLVDAIGTSDSMGKIVRAAVRERMAMAAAIATPEARQQTKHLAAFLVEHGEQAPTPAGATAEGTTARTAMDPAELQKKGAEVAQSPSTEDLSKAQAAGAKAERERSSAIFAAAAKCQNELACKLSADGTPLVEALQALAADARVRLEQHVTVPNGAANPIGGGNASDVAEKPKEQAGADLPDGLEKWQAEFSASKDLQAEFGTVEVYAGYMRNQAAVKKVRAAGKHKND